MKQARVQLRLSEAKNNFVVHAIVVAVSLFLVAFSLSAPGAAFADDVSPQSANATPAAQAEALGSQGAFAPEAGTLGSASTVTPDNAASLTTKATVSNETDLTNTSAKANVSNTDLQSPASNQNGDETQSTLTNVENSNVENSVASTSNELIAPTADVTDQPSEDSPHRLNVSFKLLYQGPDFTDGYEIGHGNNYTFVCANGNSHASTSASNHLINMSEVIAQRNILAGYLRAGFEIRGWTKSLEAGASVYDFVGDTIQCADGETIYIVATPAGPVASEFQLTYNANGGTNAPEVQTAITETGEHVFTISTTVPTREGYTFIGWSQDPGLNPPYYTAGQTITVTASTTLYAVWQVETEYTLTYMVDNVQYGAQETHAANAIVAAKGCDRVKAGYKFAGWAVYPMHDVVQFRVGDSITMSTNQWLYAVWTPVYTVTYTDGNGGTIFEDQVISDIESGASIPTFPIENPTKATINGDNYVFTGWNVDRDGRVYNNMVITAVWKLDLNNNGTADEEEATYTITYTDGTGGEVFENQVFEGLLENSTTPVFTAPRRAGYLFSGWAPNYSATVKGNVTYAAMWVADLNNNGIADNQESTYTVLYVDNVTGATYQSNEGMLSGLATPQFVGTTPTRNGYVFIGWTPAVANIVDPENADSLGYIIYAAVWAVDENNNGTADSTEQRYTITYTDGANGTVFADQVTSGLLSGLAAPQFVGSRPERTGYVFVGWSSEPTATVEGNATYTALWAVDENRNGTADVNETRYTITYTDGANGTVFADQVSSGLLSGLAAPQFSGSTPVRQGYIFAGWSSEPAQIVRGDATYTALWVLDENNNGIADSEEPRYTITYTDGVNGAAFADQVNSGLLSGVATPQFSGTPTRTGYTFVGWSTTPAQTVSGDVIYTALWEEIVEPDPTPGTDDPTPTPGTDDPAPTPGDNGSTTTPGTTEPTNPTPGTGTTGTTGGAAATAPATTTIADDETPLAAPDDAAADDANATDEVTDEAADQAVAEDAADQEISDNENPLAVADHSSSWISWLLTIALLAAVAFIGFLLIRRRKNSREQNQ